MDSKKRSPDFVVSKKYKIKSTFPNQKKFYKTCLPQTFSFSKPTMEYIWENPSTPKGYQKLIKSCKIFFVKNPIFIFNKIFYDEVVGWRFGPENGCYGLYREYTKIDINNIKATFWFNGDFSISSESLSAFAATFIPKIYRFDAKSLDLSNQIISFDELKFLSSGVKECSLRDNFIKYNNGKKVELENIIKLFSNSDDFSIYLNRNCALIKNYADFFGACNTVKTISLNTIQEEFDVHAFYQHLKKSKCRAMIRISSLHELIGSNEIVDEIIQTEFFDFVPPVIFWIGLNEDKSTSMYQIQAIEAAKYH